MQFLYLIISIYFGRKNPLFFLIFPLALLQGPGALIDSRTVLVGSELFLVGKNILKDIAVFYLMGVLIYLRNKINYEMVPKTPMKWLFIYIIVLTFNTIILYGTTNEALAVIRLYVYMVLGFYLLILLFSTIHYNQFITFFTFLFWINGIQSILYVLNSSKILPIFDDSMFYIEIESASGKSNFIRDFSTIPMFSNLLFIYGIVSIILKEKVFNNKALYLTLITYPFVLLYTFTRSILFSGILQLIVVLLVLLKERPDKVLRGYLAVILIGTMVLLGVVKSTFSNEWGYFSERLEGVAHEGKEEENVELRLEYHEKAWSLLERNNSLWIGNGLNKGLEDEMGDVGAWSADSTIPFLLIYTGILGVILYYLNQFYFLYLSKKNLFFGINSLAITLFSMILVSIFSSLIMGGMDWGSPIFYYHFVLIVFIKNQYDRAKLVKKNRSLTSDNYKIPKLFHQNIY